MEYKELEIMILQGTPGTELIKFVSLVGVSYWKEYFNLEDLESET